MRQEQIIEQHLVRCGLEAKGVSVRYQEDLQSIEVIIRPTARADRSHFECIKDAVSHGIVTFEDDAMRADYTEYTSEVARPQMLASLTATLQKLKLLEGFPARGDFPSLSEYARVLETHAGKAPGVVLRVVGDSIIFDPPRTKDYPDFATKYSDLLSVVMFASVRDHISFGFIGNEAVGANQ
jgi:hypothetical protein